MGARRGPARRSGTLARWCCAAWAKAACPRPRSGSASASAAPEPAGLVAIDPRLFRLFGIERVPAVVVVPGGVPPCRSRGCADDPAPPHDRMPGTSASRGARSRRRRGRRRARRRPPASRTPEGRDSRDGTIRSSPRPRRDRAGPRDAGHAAADLDRDVRAGLPDAVGGVRHGGAGGGPEGGGARHRQCGQCGGAHDCAGFLQRGRRAGLCRHEPAGAQHRREPAGGRRPGAACRSGRPRRRGRAGGGRRRDFAARRERAGERSDGAAARRPSRPRRSRRRTARTASPRAARRTAGRTFRTRRTAGPAGPCATASAPAARR